MKRKQPSKPTASPAIGNPELQHIEQLLRYMSEHNLEEFEYSSGDLKIRLKKPSTGTVIGVPRQMAAPEIIVAGGGARRGCARGAFRRRPAPREISHRGDLLRLA
jgi:hypothetical protein